MNDGSTDVDYSTPDFTKGWTANHFTHIVYLDRLNTFYVLHSVLMTFVNQFNTKADMLMDRLRNMADGRTRIQLFTEFNHATLDAIAQVYNTTNQTWFIFHKYLSYVLFL